MLSIIKFSTYVFVVIVLIVLFIVTLQQHDKASNTLISVQNLSIKPLDSSQDPVPDFTSFEVTQNKKRAFFGYLLPEIRRQNTIVEKERSMVKALITIADSNQANQNHFSKQEQQVFELLKAKYRLKLDEDISIQDTLDQLLIMVDIIPEELILVQAANESGWGTSRFATKGYNFFGLWCFKQGCGFIPKNRNEGAAHEVAKFKDLSHAVMTYIRNLNRLDAYQELRQIRAKLRSQNKAVTGNALSYGLMSYSERGQEYIDEIQSMLRVNKPYMDISS